ncbi:ABC transporter permease, partial [Microbacterium sp. SORGH_AS_0888]|uniref:ABC transporter permease n=1 Tax=Microbacterium sp. SORGH_AS_0888 TaxID=3041791 RepID=UPI0027D80C2A
LVIAIALGWTPSVAGIGALLLALVIVALLATGLGLLFGSINVTFRDAQSFVEIIVMCAIWASPVMYQWQAVASSLPSWAFVVYRLNPLTVAVELFHRGAWEPLTSDRMEPIPDLWTFAGIAVIVSLLVLLLGQTVFRRLEGRFAQDL